MTALQTTKDRLVVSQEVSYLILELARRLQDNFTHHANEVGLTVSQAKVLVALGDGETMSMRSLAERLGFDPSNLTAPVDHLEAEGFVERRPDPRDRRVKAVVSTADGSKLRGKFWAAMSEDVSFVDHLSASQLGNLRDLLRAATHRAG